MKQIFALSRKFYWDVIEDIHRNNVNNENLGWEKGVYPSDDFIQNSLTKGELYTLTEKDTLYACVILNSEHNEGYDKCTWSITCDSSQVLTPHALAVNPAFQGKGIGKIVVKNILVFLAHAKLRNVSIQVVGSNLSRQNKCFTKILGGQSTKCLN